MPKLRVHNMAVSLDGYAAGPDQSLDDPLGVGGTAAHEWVFATRTGRQIGGGVSTVQQYLRAGLIDDLHAAIVPVLLGRGERLFDRLDGGPRGYECVELVSSPAVTHVRLARS
jgi:dihydrofolate reductase